MAVKNKQEAVTTKDALQLAIADLEKDYGKGTVITAGFKPEVYDVTSSGSLGLDIALGIGGFAKGKTYEFLGWESSGKSTGTLEAIANAQANGDICALIDGEHSFDPTYAKAVGVNVDALLINQPSYGEQGYNVAMRLMNSGKLGMLVIDSQTSLLPKKVIESDMGEGGMGLHARLMSEAIPKMMAAAARNKVTLIIISQLREKIGVMFGNPETTNGGHALKFYAHGRLRWQRKAAPNKDGDEAVSNATTVKVIKNKMAAPFKIAEFDIVYGKGIDRKTELLKLAVDLEIIQKSGSWFAYGDNKIGQGAEAVALFFEDNPEFMAEIKDKVMTSIRGGIDPTTKLSIVKEGIPELEEFDDETNAEKAQAEIEALTNQQDK